jgi:hypothetical protein
MTANLVRILCHLIQLSRFTIIGLAPRSTNHSGARFKPAKVKGNQQNEKTLLTIGAAAVFMTSSALALWQRPAQE